LEKENPGATKRPAPTLKKEAIKMIPFGFEPNDYNAMIDFQIDFKALRRQCKALVKKVGRKMKRK